MIDKYELRAQFMPALLCSAPFIAFGFYFLSRLDTTFWGALLAQTVGGITMTFALYYLAAFVCRHVGKWLEDWMFKEGKDFPTTSFLLDRDANCSPERKKEILVKIKKEFEINLEGKTTDTAANRRRIHEAIGQVRRRFFKKNEMILQRNIQFGFSKNIAGGALVSALVSMALTLLAVLANDQQALQIALVLAVIYLVLAVYGLVSMGSNAKRYAQTLFDEFLAS